MKKILFCVASAVIAGVALSFCVNSHKAEKNAKNGKDGWHLLVPHNKGNEMEDPDGCPCACLMLGWSSYANLTNAAAHGFRSPYDELEKRQRATNGVVRLVSVYEMEKEIISEINAKEGEAK